ncbi:putative papain-like cysteine peptidase superfamily [Helianthus anomalus]
MWTHLYKGCPMTPSRIVERIVCNQDDDGVFFKCDFLALFMNTMVEINKDGTCKTDFLECLNEDIAVENMNWCKFIYDTIKNSKDGWQRDNMSIYFNDALTILVVNDIRGPNHMWIYKFSSHNKSALVLDKDMLSIREKYEIKNGGFGKGSLREGYMEDRVSDNVSFKGGESVAHVTDVKGVGVDVHGRDADRGIDGKGSVNSDDIGKIQPVSFEEHMSLIQQLIDETLWTKALVVKKLDEACSKYPNNENVIEFVGQYDKVFRGEHKMAKLIISTGTVDVNEKDKVDTVTGRVEGSMEGACKLADTLADADKRVVKGQVKGKSHDEKEVNYSIPSFMMLSQSSQSSPDPEVESSVHGNYLLTVMDDKRGGERNKKNNKKNDDEEIDIEQEMKEIRLTFNIFFINTLEEEKWISQNVIHCWAALLNYMEKKENPSGKRRLWCYTTTIPKYMLKAKQTEKRAFATITSHLKEVVECDNELLKLRDFNIIIVPMIEKKHFYMICFDLDNATVEVVDNMHDSFAFYKMTLGKGTGKGTSFRSLGSPSKKHYIVGYLKDVGHPTASRMVNANVTRNRLGWETTDNFNDCSVFTMRHMEMYKGSDISFECSFSTIKIFRRCS